MVATECTARVGFTTIISATLTTRPAVLGWALWSLIVRSGVARYIGVGSARSGRVVASVNIVRCIGHAVILFCPAVAAPHVLVPAVALGDVGDVVWAVAAEES